MNPQPMLRAALKSRPQNLFQGKRTRTSTHTYEQQQQRIKHKRTNNNPPHISKLLQIKNVPAAVSALLQSMDWTRENGLQRFIHITRIRWLGIGNMRPNTG